MRTQPTRRRVRHRFAWPAVLGLRLCLCLCLCLGVSPVAAAVLAAEPGESWDPSPSARAGAVSSASWRHALAEDPAAPRLRLLPVTWLIAAARLDPPARDSASGAIAGRASYAAWLPALPEADGLRLGDRPLVVVQSGLEAARGAWRTRAAVRVEATSGGPTAGALPEAAVLRDGARHTWRLGRVPVRWGYGVQGGLLFSRSALPLWQLGWSASRPLAAPGWHRLGTWTGDVFLAYLDDERRAVPRPLLLGHRTAWQPTEWLELAGSRTILFGGEGRTRRLTLGRIGNILWGRAENTEGPRGPSDSDQRASFEGRANLLPATARRLGLGGGEVYFEYAGEDAIHPPLPAAVGHLFGAVLHRDGWQARVEFAETVSRNRWYDHHSVYRDSHFYRGAPLGIRFGPDVESTWFGLTTPPRPARLRLSRTEQLLGKISGNRERRVAWQARLRIDLPRALALECEMDRTRRIGPGLEPRAPRLVRHAVVLRLTAGSA